MRFSYHVLIGICILWAINLVSITRLVAAEKNPGDWSMELKSVITEVLTKQSKAWNAGDLGRFMESYWNSNQLTFSSGGKTLRGWEETKLRYETRYPTPAKMGRLSFGDLEMFSLGDDSAYVLGRWSLRRQAGDLEGNFTLVFRKINGRWLIVHDHSSLLPNEVSTKP
ncbi:MAG: DUF4440 domain-containing protein [Planctomycetaceae bacterium]|nr:DUF4440 domain-containing protein [Planctomycetaceae bacterium]